MRIIPREARKITYSTEIRNLKKSLELNDFQESVIIGSILGDAHLEPNWSKTNYRLKVQHSIKQKDYVMWKYSILKDWVLTEPKPQLVNNSIRFRTISHPKLTALHRIFYRDKQKIIPANITELLDPIVLAIWFMDDGNAYRSKGATWGYGLNTQSFTLTENKSLIDLLKNRFGLECTLHDNHSKPRIYIGSKSKNRFNDVISDYVLPSMKYKLG